MSSIYFFVGFLLVVAFGQQCDVSKDVARFDCFPWTDASQDKCQKRGCCWKEPSETKIRIGRRKNLTMIRDVNVPYCFYPRDYPQYEIQSQTETDFGVRIQLSKKIATFEKNDLLNLTVDLIYETSQRFRMKIYDPNSERFQVPLPVPKVEKKAQTTDYAVVLVDQPFSIKVTRRSTGAVLFDSSVAPLVYADQFLRISTSLTSPLIYGLGEHRQSLLINATAGWKKLTFWSRDFPPVLNTNLYGVHPFYLNLETFDDGRPTNVHGQFLLNSNAMDIDLQPLPALTYTTIGGIIDLYIFTGPNVDDVIEQYWDVIGKPMMPPFWSLGFHLCRYGYESIENLRKVIQRMHDADFPYDVQWTDIDAMRSYLDFTYDPKNFEDLPKLVQELHAGGKHYVNIIDPGISSDEPAGTYPPFDDGMKKDIFIKNSNGTGIIIGKVWPGNTAFPDFTNPDAIEWWTNAATQFHEQVQFDGMWIDMNEPSNFVDGSLNGCTDNDLDNPPFTPNVLGGKLSSKSLCPSAQQSLSTHYNLHSMFGYFEAVASNAAMKTIRQTRPFVLTRSSFAGSGQFAAHWTGDNRATFDDMYYSIPAILSFNMFGLTHVGADICGFGLDTTDELCTRWMQLGAFYPFMRNHNDMGQKDQDPAAFPWENQQIMKQAVMMRYSLIPFWYTLHHQASMKSKTIVQPLFFEFPNDKRTFNIDQQFLVGRALLVSPNLVSGTTTVDAYFPSALWYEFPSGVPLKLGNTSDVILDAPLSKLNVHLRGGFIIPTQTPGENLIIGRGNPLTLIVASSQYQNASGNLYWDDGDSIDSIEKQNYNYFEFLLTSDNKLTIDALVRNYKDEPMRLDIVKILGVEQQVKNVTINGKTLKNFLYNVNDKILFLYGLDLDLLASENQTIQWTF